MRRLALVVTLLALLVAIAWLLALPRAPSSSEADASSATGDRATVELARDASAPAELAVDVTEAPRAPEAEVDAPASAGDPVDTACVVRGRVVDDAGIAIADAHVSLYPVGGAPFAEGRPIATVEQNGRRHEVVRTTSGADGRFELRVPVPTADWITLDASATEFHLVESRMFGPAGGRNLPRLVAGENELGDVVLPTAGGARGRVLGADGTPIAGAVVQLDTDARRVASGTTGADGRYELARALPGTWRAEVLADGWRRTTIDGVVIGARRWTDGVDATLERASTIEGVVVDELGAPLADVRVVGRPVDGGGLAYATSGADGRFALAVREAAPHALVPRDEQLFELVAGGRFAPGARDARLVVRAKTPVRFHVVDAASGRPVTRFAAAVEELPSPNRMWNRFQRIGAASEHADGDVELPARPAKDAIGVLAPGYAPFEATVALDEGSRDAQTVRLARGATLTGRLVLGDAPPERASLRLGRERLEREPAKPVVAHTVFDRRAKHDLGDLAGRERVLAAETDGSFRVADLAEGTYRLTIDAQGAARRTIGSIVVGEGAAVDLGRVELEREGLVEGRVLLPPGRAPTGIEVLLDATDLDARRAVQLASADGRFAFGGLAAGEHALLVQERKTFAPPLAEARVAVAAGATVEVVLDARGAVQCDVAVTVTRGGAPAADVRVAWTANEADGRRTRGEPFATNAEGVARARLDGAKRGRFAALAPSGIECARSDELELPAEGRFEHALAIDAGELVIELPEDLAVPDNGAVDVTLRRADDATGLQHLSVATQGSPFASGSTRWTTRRIELGATATGSYVVTVRAVARRPRSPEEPRAWVPELLRALPETTVEVRANETTTVKVP